METYAKKTGLYSVLKNDATETDNVQREFDNLSNKLVIATDKLNKVNQEIVGLQDDLKAESDNENSLRNILDKLKLNWKEARNAADIGDNEVKKLEAEIAAK